MREKDVAAGRAGEEWARKAIYKKNMHLKESPKYLRNLGASS